METNISLFTYDFGQILTFNQKQSIDYPNYIYKFIKLHYLYLSESIKWKFRIKDFKNKYAYSQLKDFHKDINNTIKVLNSNSFKNIRIAQKFLTLLSEVSEFLDLKKEMESQFLTDLMQSFKEVNELTNRAKGETMDKMIKAAENELQNH